MNHELPSRFILCCCLLFLFRSPLAHAENKPFQEAMSSLNQAVQYYQMSNRSAAMKHFLSIASDQSYPESIRQEARIYMAEILYLENNIESAQIYFEEVLLENPSYAIDRFRHPPEICDYFDQVKASIVVPPVTPISPPKNNRPWLRFLPFGLYQFDRNQNGKALLCSTQVITGISSVVLFSYLSNNHAIKKDGSDNIVSGDNLDLILGLQRASGIAFYSTWSLCSWDAHRNWTLKQGN